MHNNLTWKRKVLSSRFTLFAALTAGFMNVSLLIAQNQQDTVRPVELPPVEIQWVRPSGELPFAGTDLNRQAIEKEIGNGSINNIMENIPSMITSSEAGNGLGNTSMRLRGIDHTRINVTINGIELNDAESHGTWFVNMPNFGSYVQHLTLQRGIGTSSNGAAVFGASMNFQTLGAQQNAPFLEISSAAGSFFTFRNSITAGSGLIKDRFSVTASYSNLQSKGYVDRATANLNSAYINAKYLLINKKKNKNYGTLSFNMLYGKEKTGLAWNGTARNMLETNRTFNSCGAYYDANGIMHYYGNETDNYQQNHYQLFYDKDLTTHKNERIQQWNFHAGLHLTRGIGYYEQYKNDRKYSNYGLDAVWNADSTKELKKDLVSRKYLDNYFYGMVFDISENIYSPKSNNSIKWTVGGGINRYDSKHYGDVVWLETVGELEEFYRWYNNKAQKLQANIYGKVEYILKERILIYGDLQYRYIDYNVEGLDDNLRDLTHRYTWNNFFNPKVGANFFLDRKKHHSLYASFAMSHREPSRSDLVDAPADRLPKAETLYDMELGYTLNIRKFAFNANAYYMNYKDQLVLTGELNDVGDAMVTNVDKSFRAGLELVASYRPCRFFLWRINGSYSVNKIMNYINYVIDYDTYTYIEENLGTTNISFSPSLVAGNEFVFTPFRNFDISWQNKFVGKQYLDNTGNEDFILKPYILGSLQFNYSFEIGKMPKIGLFLSINNLYNQKYESNGALYQYISEGERYYEDYYNPQAGINFMTGISVKF